MTKQLFAVFLSLALVVPAHSRITGTQPTNADIACWGPDGAEVCVQADGSIVPTTTNDADLGTSSLKWNELHLTAGGLTDSAVEAGDIAAGAIVTAKLASDAVISSKISDGGVTTDKIASGSITTTKIMPDAVIAASILNGSVTTTKIGSNAVTNDKLYINLTGLQLVCITTAKLLGVCTLLNASTGLCNNCQ